MPDDRPAYRVLLNWFECDECADGELRAVVRLGELAIPMLRATLADGPSEVAQLEYSDHLSTTYRELERYAKRTSNDRLMADRKIYFTIYGENFIEKYKVRAAMALHEIDTVDARSALESAAVDVEQSHLVRAYCARLLLGNDD